MEKNFVIIILTLYSVQTIQDKCPFNRKQTVALSLGAYKNRSCHYITKWSLTNNLSELPDNIKVDVKSRVFELNGQKTFNVQGMVVAPEGYEYFPDIGYYKFYPEGVDSFLKAKKVCENDGAHLAIINSDAEAEVLMEIYKNFPEAGLIAYLGFHDMRKEGEFETIFGEPLSTTGYTRWQPGNPDNWENEDCGSMTKYGLLIDSPCDKNGLWPFFCEFDLNWR